MNLFNKNNNKYFSISYQKPHSTHINKVHKDDQTEYLEKKNKFRFKKKKI
jgi:hypothetical protein